MSSMSGPLVLVQATVNFCDDDCQVTSLVDGYYWDKIVSVVTQLIDKDPSAYITIWDDDTAYYTRLGDLLHSVDIINDPDQVSDFQASNPDNYTGVVNLTHVLKSWIDVQYDTVLNKVTADYKKTLDSSLKVFRQVKT